MSVGSNVAIAAPGTSTNQPTESIWKMILTFAIIVCTIVAYCVYIGYGLWRGLTPQWYTILSHVGFITLGVLGIFLVLWSNSAGGKLSWWDVGGLWAFGFAIMVFSIALASPHGANSAPFKEEGLHPQQRNVGFQVGPPAMVTLPAMMQMAGGADQPADEWIMMIHIKGTNVQQTARLPDEWEWVEVWGVKDGKPSKTKEFWK
jgi:hypothetical protein